MKTRLLFLSVTAAAACAAQPALAQYPTIPPDVQAKADALLADAQKHSDEAWAKALPIIEQEAKQGKPYVPWAAKPSDLPQAKVTAFPGAEGGGAYAFGGRGGKVFVVTSLDDSGPGTLREACEQGGARTVVFNVAGIIRLKSPISIRAPYITIAGQTAPGDGVCVAGESLWIDTHDVVIRYLRFRRGATEVGRRDDGLGGNGIGNIIIDHVSASWGLDENMSMYRHVYHNPETGKADKLPTVNVTIQNSIFSEGLDTYNHAFGSTIGGLNSAFVRNLWANNISRNPSVGMYGDFNFANNVVFNWWNRSADGGDNRSEYNFVNNYYKPGPITPLDQPISFRILKAEASRDKALGQVYGKAYVAGNVIEGNEKVTKDNWAGGVQLEDVAEPEKILAAIRTDKPFAMPNVGTVLSAQEAYRYVLDNVGAALPRRDAVDARIVEEVRTGKIVYAKDAKDTPVNPYIKRRLPADSYKQGIITDPQQVGGYPEYKGKPYVDSDKDGMPDDWEKKHGLNPKDAADAAKDRDNDGYTNIEEYLNSVVDTQKVKPAAPGTRKS
ncbi:pectate lyase family protein [Hymenobacter jeollabukensis]|uniref:Polysaccharide lyase n=1 Tax=Hymenobacter jeollabukensis TaxID=2025313 RepID=A0A5R8WKW3_9BACT|nr:polysaccharide lyase [Hymenobacter jeollabukensis]TLM89802.1 polysaccharide lyase [Hymenobacter jeollabukensis]